MTDYCLTSAGFLRKPRRIIIREMKEAAKIAFGETVNTDDTTPLGMFIGVIAASLDDTWQLAESLYYSAFLATATGTSLDNIGEYIGILRRPAIPATGLITISGSNGVDIPTGFRVATEEGIEFYVSNGGTISEGSVTLPITATMPGTQGNIRATFISEIPIPMIGVDSVTNESATTGGLRVETDAEFRQRYRKSVAKPGSSTSASIEATILEVNGVTEALVRQNTSNIEVSGIPPHSIAPLVYGGDDGKIGQAIFGVKSAGIQSAAVGADPGLEVEITIQDSLGEDHIIGFARPNELEIHIDCELDTDASFPVDGISRVVTALVNYINGLGIGDDIIYTRLIGRIQTVPGIIDITNLKIGIVIANTEANIIVSSDEIARIDSGDITVTEV